MKRFTSFLMLGLFLLSFSPLAFADVEEYPVKIGGESFTSEMSVIRLESGLARYDHENKILTLEGVQDRVALSIDFTKVAPIEAFTIKLRGFCDLVRIGIKGVTSLTIDGEQAGRLASDLKVVSSSDATVIIQNCSFEGEFSGKEKAENPATINLKVKNAYAKFTARETHGTLTGLKSIESEGCKITEPDGAVIGKNGGDEAAVVPAQNSTDPVESKVIFGEKYPVGVGVLPFSTGLTKVFGLRGFAEYNHDKKTVTFDNFTASINFDNEAICIVSFSDTPIEEFYVKLKGKNRAFGGFIFDGITQSVTIDGGGEGELDLTGYIAAHGDNTVLTIKDCRIDGIGMDYPVLLTVEKPSSLVLENVDLTVVCNTGLSGVVGAFKDITLKGCEITYPEGAKVEEMPNVDGVKSIFNADGTPCSDLKIQRTGAGDNKNGDNGNGDDEKKDKESAVESELLAGVSAWPNPFSGVLRVDRAEAVARYALYSSLGQAVLSGRHDGGAQLTLETGQLASGIYILRLEATDGVKIIKLIRE